MKKIFIWGNRSILRNYAQALEQCGAVPVFSDNMNLAHDCAGLLLPGGGDPDPALYHQSNNGSYNIDRDRDRAELELIRLFSAAGRPILGICRGMQILNIAFGGDLVQDLEGAESHRWDGKIGDQVHEISVEKESFLFPLYGNRFRVNSAHHQGVGRPAEGMTRSARSDDGVLEAMELPEKGIFAVQWHPERMCFQKRRPDTVDGRLVFDCFLRCC